MTHTSLGENTVLSTYGRDLARQTTKISICVEGHLLFTGVSGRTGSQILQFQPIFPLLVLAKVKEHLAPFQTLAIFFHHYYTACSVQFFIDWKAFRGWEKKTVPSFLQEQEML